MLTFLYHNIKDTLSVVTKSYNTNSLQFLMVIFLVITTIIIINFSVCPMFDCCRRRCRKFYCLQQIYQQPHLLITQKKENINDYLFRIDFIKKLSVNFSMRNPVEICELSSLRCETSHPFFPPYLFLKFFWKSLCLFTSNLMICLFNVQYSMSVTFSSSSLFSNNFILTFDSLQFVIIDIFKQLVTFISFFQSSQHVFYKYV